MGPHASTSARSNPSQRSSSTTVREMREVCPPRAYTTHDDSNNNTAAVADNASLAHQRNSTLNASQASSTTMSTTDTSAVDASAILGGS